MSELLLKLRKSIKSKRPTLRRHDSHKKSALKSAWRKPRGLQNKIRLQKKGYTVTNNLGWASPNKVRGLNNQGLKPIVISNIKELEKINPKQESVILSSTVGAKKKAVILERAKALKIMVDNVKDLDLTIKKINEKFSTRKSEKDIRIKEKAAKVSKAEKSKAKKLDEKVESVEKVEKDKQELSEEDKKKAIEAEKQKVLTHK